MSNELPLLGLIVNPISGMGGSVGLKGTDGQSLCAALKLGAQPVSPERAATFLSSFSGHDEVRWLAAPDQMGARHMQRAGIDCEVLGTIGNPTSSDDTIRLAHAMGKAGVEALVFVGGDGTARNIVDAVGLNVPVIGVPAGVKVYSAAFANNPISAARLLETLLHGADLAEEEVLDLNEDAYREGRVESTHYGYLLIPVAESLVQSGKESSDTSGSATQNKQAIAAQIVSEMQDQTLYLLGTGTTVQHIGLLLNIETTLLGIDAVLDGRLVGLDLSENAILTLLRQYTRSAIVVTPLGGNGFILGRGNKPLTPRVLRTVGLRNVIVVADRNKLLRLPGLLVDTGDASLDQDLAGYISVIVGTDHEKLMRVN